MGTTTPKLLLIEDNKHLAEMYAKKLNLSGYNVTIAKDGHAGLEKAKSEAFDMIVLDLMLPGIQGVDVLGMIRSDSKTTKTPIIVYTNHGDIKSKEKCLLYGADEFILKIDTDPEGLCQSIGRLLTEKKIETI